MMILLHIAFSVLCLIVAAAAAEAGKASSSSSVVAPPPPIVEEIWRTQVFIPQKASKPLCWTEAIQTLSGLFQPEESGPSFCSALTQSQQNALALELARCHMEKSSTSFFGSEATERDCSGRSLTEEGQADKCLSELDANSYNMFVTFLIHVQQLCVRFTDELVAARKEQAALLLAKSSHFATEQLKGLMEKNEDLVTSFARQQELLSNQSSLIKKANDAIRSLHDQASSTAASSVHPAVQLMSSWYFWITSFFRFFGATSVVWLLTWPKRTRAVRSVLSVVGACLFSIEILSDWAAQNGFLGREHQQRGTLTGWIFFLAVGVTLSLRTFFLSVMQKPLLSSPPSSQASLPSQPRQSRLQLPVKAQQSLPPSLQGSPSPVRVLPSRKKTKQSPVPSGPGGARAGIRQQRVLPPPINEGGQHLVRPPQDHVKNKGFHLVVRSLSFFFCLSMCLLIYWRPSSISNSFFMIVASPLPLPTIAHVHHTLEGWRHQVFVTNHLYTSKVARMVMVFFTWVFWKRHQNEHIRRMAAMTFEQICNKLATLPQGMKESKLHLRDEIGNELFPNYATAWPFKDRKWFFARVWPVVEREANLDNRILITSGPVPGKEGASPLWEMAPGAKWRRMEQLKKNNKI